MSGLYLSRGLYPVEFLKPTVAFILKAQRPWGEIPWFEGGHSDPWDHTEAAMGLSIAGEYAPPNRPTVGWPTASWRTAVGGAATGTASLTIRIAGSRTMWPMWPPAFGIIT